MAIYYLWLLVITWFVHIIVDHVNFGRQTIRAKVLKINGEWLSYNWKDTDLITKIS